MYVQGDAATQHISWSTKKSEGMGGDEIDARNRREGVEANRRKKWEQNTETRSAFKKTTARGRDGCGECRVGIGKL
jgi:hypothetical protein